MGDLNIKTNMIGESIKILSEYKTKKILKGYDYNIFSLLDIERKEYEVHEKMIYNILTFPFDKRISKLFIRKFMEVMEMPGPYIETEWDVIKEYATVDYGRIDLFFQSKENKNNRKCIIVELKIDAQDQHEQLYRYAEYVSEKMGIKDFRIVYITLDGHGASEQSLGLVDKNKVKDNISYVYIKKWLDMCVNVCKEQEIEDSFIKQYIKLIEKIYGDNEMEKSIDNLITTKDELLAAMEISSSLIHVKTEVLKEFMKSVKKEVSKLKMEPILENIDDNAENYFKKATIPFLTYYIKDFKCSTFSKVSIVLELYIEHDLEFNISYYDTNLDYIKSSDFKSKQKRRASIIEEAITAVFGTVVRDNRYSSIIYRPVLDKHDHKYDFKHFTENCCNLIDEEERNLEAERIARQMVSYIKLIKKELQCFS